MRKYLRPHRLLVALLVALSVGVVGWADDDHDDDDDRRGRRGRKSRTTLEFDEIRFFFEFNAADEDLGVQLNLGATAWKRLKILGPDGDEILEVSGENTLEEFGLATLFFESNEPTFDVVPKEEILDLFPPGTYKFRGLTIDGNRLKGSAKLTHDLPDAPVILTPEEDEVVAAGDVTVTWSEVTTPAGIEIESYEVIVTNDDNPRFVYDVRVSADARSLTVPAEFFEPETTYELEILAVEKSGNQTIGIIFFETE